MPRRKLITSDAFPYHITNRSNNREFWYLPMDILWGIFLEKLQYLETELDCKIQVFVLMTNHYHLVIQTPKANIHEAMKYLNREVARSANKFTGRINHFFGGRYTWSLICDERYYWNAIKYAFRNPIEAGMSHRVEDYRYSSFNCGSEVVNWSLTEWLDDAKGVRLDVDWLNHRFTDNQSDSLRKALRRKEFKLPQLVGGKLVTLDEVQSEKGTITFRRS